MTTEIKADIEAINRITMVPHILDVICNTTGMRFAAVARVTDKQWITCSVLDKINFGLVPGSELELETTICHEIRQSGKAVIIDNVDASPVFRDHHTPAMYGFKSYISVPIILKSGEFFGTLCAIDPDPNHLDNADVKGMFNLYADLISFHLDTVEQMSFNDSILLEERKAISLQKEFNEVLSTANSRLAETKQKLEQAIEAGKMGTWSIDTVTFKVTMSNFIKELFGFDLDREVEISRIIAAVDPDHREQLTKVLTNAIENLEVSDIEYPINNLKTGERKWVRATGKAFFDAEGKIMEYSGMLMDVTERKLDDLRKNDFIGMVSHELKTPLTSLSAYAQMLHTEAKRKDDVFTGKALEKVNRQIKKMSTMINGFLNISRLESGKISLDKHDFDLNDLINDMVDEAKMIGSAHTITTTLCDNITLNADEDKIGSVISNLLSNAIKYSPKGQLIDIKCEVIGDNVRVSIKDEGMGIKPHDMDKLFDRYYRIETKHTAHISGFGIGLYLSAEIIKRHNGRIWAESESGKGSTFYFELPLGG